MRAAAQAFESLDLARPAGGGHGAAAGDRQARPVAAGNARRPEAAEVGPAARGSPRTTPTRSTPRWIMLEKQSEPARAPDPARRRVRRPVDGDQAARLDRAQRRRRRLGDDLRSAVRPTAAARADGEIRRCRQLAMDATWAALDSKAAKLRLPSQFSAALEKTKRESVRRLDFVALRAKTMNAVVRRAAGRLHGGDLVDLVGGATAPDRGNRPRGARGCPRPRQCPERDGDAVDVDPGRLARSSLAAIAAGLMIMVSRRVTSPLNRRSRRRCSSSPVAT